MKYFYGANKKKSYFEGWYLKQQNQRDTLAFIPAWHVDRKGRAQASLQVIANQDCWSLDYPAEAFAAARDRFFVELGDSVFSKGGIILNAKSAGLEVKGALRYGALTPVAGDIMGPFQYVPFLQCRHSVLSMGHRVDGRISVNGRDYTFEHGRGYIEGDRGHSFPKGYIWTQASFRHEFYGDGSVMISIADIPFCGGRFTGCLAFVWLGGREYRLSTYQGVRILSANQGLARLRQGELALEAELLEAPPFPCGLRAPQGGSMIRTVHESPACKVRYRFSERGRPLLDLVSGQAGFEYSGSLGGKG